LFNMLTLFSLPSTFSDKGLCVISSVGFEAVAVEAINTHLV
jgi:hypothetical protein